MRHKPGVCGAAAAVRSARTSGRALGSRHARPARVLSPGQAADAVVARCSARATPERNALPAERVYAGDVDAADLTRLTAETLYLVLLVSAPALLASLLLGLVIGVLQALTQVQEQTLSFVPKLVGVAIVLATLGGWMSAQLVRFTTTLWTAIPSLVG